MNIKTPKFVRQLSLMEVFRDELLITWCQCKSYLEIFYKTLFLERDLKSLVIFRLFLRLLLLYIGLQLLVFSVSAQSKIFVKIFPDNLVKNDTVKLGEIAKISDERLKNISLGYSPNIGSVREISRQQILLSLNAAGFSENDLKLDLPTKILVRRASQTIEKKTLRETIEKAILQNFVGEDLQIKITRIDLPEKIEIPTGEISLQTSLNNVQNFFSSFTVSIEVKIDGKTLQRVSANVETEAFADVFVATRDLLTGEKISEIDVRIEQHRLEKPLSNYLRSDEKLNSISLVKNISKGSVLTTDSITARYVIKSGDTVRIIGTSGKLQVSVSGEARSSGKIGDRIAVKNSQSGKILQAIVVDEGLVKINF